MKDYVVPFLAVILLAIWLCCFAFIVHSLGSGAPPNPDSLTFVFSTVGALIAGVSIVELGVKDPANASPKIGMVLSVLSPAVTKVQTLISAGLLVGWLIVGMAAMYFWLFWHPGKDATPWSDGIVLIQNHAKAWIGFAIAAVYAYLGVNPK